MDLAGLLQKHRHGGLLVDSNLLLLFLVGLIGRDRIAKFKRTGNTRSRILDCFIG